MHAVAGKAACFAEAMTLSFQAYGRQVVQNAAVFAEELTRRGYILVSGGTDNHLVLIDLRPNLPHLSGEQASKWLEQAGIVTNKNTVPQDDRSPFVTSGLRLGTPALTTRGFKQQQMVPIAGLIDRVLTGKGGEQELSDVRQEVLGLCRQFPLNH